MLFVATPVPLPFVVLLRRCPAHQALFSYSFSLHLDFGIGNPSLQTIDSPSHQDSCTFQVCSGDYIQHTEHRRHCNVKILLSGLNEMQIASASCHCIVCQDSKNLDHQQCSKNLIHICKN